MRILKHTCDCDCLIIGMNEMAFDVISGFLGRRHVVRCLNSQGFSLARLTGAVLLV